MTARPGELEVRCCCNPEVVLGWLPVPYPCGSSIAVALRAETSLPPGLRFESPSVSPCYRLEIGTVSSLEEPKGHAAIKSMHLPIETLRKIPGFRENVKCGAA